MKNEIVLPLILFLIFSFFDSNCQTVLDSVDNKIQWKTEIYSLENIDGWYELKGKKERINIFYDSTKTEGIPKYNEYGEVYGYSYFRDRLYFAVKFCPNELNPALSQILEYFSTDFDNFEASCFFLSPKDFISKKKYFTIKGAFSKNLTAIIPKKRIKQFKKTDGLADISFSFYKNGEIESGLDLELIIVNCKK